MPPSSGELWGHHLMPPQVSVDCLMPTGVIIPIKCARDTTLERMKSELFLEAKKFPLHYLLSESTSYIFVSITQDAEKEEFYDESRRLCDLRLFQPILKVVEPKGNREEKMLNYDIGLAVSMPVTEFNEIKDLETVTFRRSILQVCRESVMDREAQGRLSQALYSYPPEIESSSQLPPHIEEKLQRDADRIIVCIWVMSADKSREKYSVQVHHMGTPDQVIAEAIRRRTRTMGLTVDEQQKCIQEYTDAYVLKVCGCDQFFLAKFPFSQFKYIRQCIAQEKIPQLMLMTKKSVYDSLPVNYFNMPGYAEKGKYALADINKQPTKSLWELHTQLRIQINCATYVNVREVGKIYVKTGVYHGMESLCPNKDTARVESSNPRWTEWLEYDLYIPDIPRCARLCFSICTVNKKKKQEQHYALAWGNLQLFDFNNRLLSDKLSLHLWPMPQGMDDLLNPIGIPGSNPDKDCPCLEIGFDRFTHPVSYPPDCHIDELAAFVSTQDDANSFYHRGTTAPIYDSDDGNHVAQELEILDKVIAQDPLSEISEQDKDLLWKYRRYCAKTPYSLPKVLTAVKWNSREEVVQLYMLLKEWPSVPLETSLELLDCSYPDLRVRQFAVESLEENLTDEQLSQYLLQLVQALKFEPYLDNPTSRFLLRRSLLNQKIGHFFFWHLKSELHQTNIRLRFGLILEAYCRGCGAYLKSLIRQVEAQDKLTNLTDTFKGKDNHEEQRKLLLEHFKHTDYQEALQNLTSPLNNSHILGDLYFSKCKVHQSKKRPLSLVWHNPDPMADLFFTDYRLMFKNGDDLRQDMLTLQVLRIMDSIWESEGLDMRLIPYGCMATGKDVGMIELVRNSMTVMAIQKRALGGAMQVDSSQLHKWIKENNKGDKYEQAIDAFTRSCAGYCVATFVLGIGDRHSENIMVTKDGRVFHIDFGHFLNHKKKKFGINRERVPFVLTDDFLRVIAHGVDNPIKSEEFEKFQRLCGLAYRCLRKHANLFIVLFTMMLSCGIPELQSLDDIGYLRKTLAVEKTEEEALSYFHQQLQDAYRGAWSTKLNFLFHVLGQSLK